MIIFGRTSFDLNITYVEFVASLALWSGSAASQHMREVMHLPYWVTTSMKLLYSQQAIFIGHELYNRSNSTGVSPPACQNNTTSKVASEPVFF